MSDALNEAVSDEKRHELMRLCVTDVARPCDACTRPTEREAVERERAAWVRGKMGPSFDCECYLCAKEKRDWEAEAARRYPLPKEGE